MINARFTLRFFVFSFMSLSKGKARYILEIKGSFLPHMECDMLVHD